jgi:membrane protease YdiL (CAAX protease family)
MWTTRVVVFYILTFVFTIVLGGIQEAAGISQTSIILPQWGPGLAGLAMLLIFRKDRLRITFFDRRAPASRYLFAALIPIGGAVLIYLIYRLFFGAPSAGAATATATPWILLLWFPLGAISEELGWRGYLHNRLNADMVGLASSVVVGTLWAFWHVGSYQNGALYTLFFMLLMISYSVVIYALVSRIGFNVLVAAIFHLMINIGNLFSFAIVNRVEFLMVSSLVWAAIAVVVVLTRKPLFGMGPSAPGTGS